VRVSHTNAEWETLFHGAPAFSGICLCAACMPPQMDSSDVSEFCAHLASSMNSLRDSLLEVLGQGGSEGSDAEDGVCEMCGRATALTKHHLIPR
jgi:hypothetical protein